VKYFDYVSLQAPSEGYLLFFFSFFDLERPSRA
jgi:hypothetical protein